MPPLLEDIAEVRTGLTLRGKDASLRTSEEGLHLLRIRDLTETGYVHIENKHIIEATPAIIEKYQVRAGDIVIANRGSRTTAAIVPPDTQAIAGGQLFTIRLKTDSVLTGYLHWFLNYTHTRSQLLAQLRGSYVQTMPISVMRKLPITVPPLETQHKIQDLANLSARERRLVKKISKLRQKHLDASLSALITNRITH